MPTYNVECCAIHCLLWQIIQDSGIFCNKGLVQLHFKHIICSPKSVIDTIIKKTGNIYPLQTNFQLNVHITVVVPDMLLDISQLEVIDFSSWKSVHDLRIVNDIIFFSIIDPLQNNFQINVHIMLLYLICCWL